MPSSMKTSDAFEQKLLQYRQENRNARPYDIAKALGASELEILIRSSETYESTRLRADWKEIFAAYARWGRCMALTRNDAVVSEVKGEYGEASFQGPMGLVHAEAIDLRMFCSSWMTAYAVEQKKEDAILRSVQIFDRYGRAVHKTYPEALADADWKAFVSSLEDQGSDLNISDPKERSGASVPQEFDREAFRTDWSKLQDTHDFFVLLRKHGVDRQAAFEVVGKDYAEELSPESLVDLLQGARKSKLPIMIFVGNSGMLQIRSGVVQTTRELGSWYNVLDPDFNLHANMKKLKRAWIVRKPTRFGTISSLEIFDEEGELAISIFGYRKDETAPSEEWRTLLEGLTSPAIS